MSEWAPLIGSSIIAFATLVVLIVNQRHNRETLRLARQQHQETLDAAESREWLQWKRTRVATLCDEVLTVAHVAGSSLRGAPAWGDAEFQGNWFNVNNGIAAIPDLARRLELIVGLGLDKQITAINNALADGMSAAKEPSNRPSFNVPLGTALVQMTQATQPIADTSRAFASAARKLLQEPPIDQTDSPHSTGPSDPADPEAPSQGG
jgi:hypothetical protein